VTVEDDGPVLRASVPLSGCTAEFALSMFTDPVQLARWWNGELHTELLVGGPYAVRFPGLGQTMAGQLLSYEPARFLEFTWGWEHESGAPRRAVAVRVDGTRATVMTIEHGPYGDDEGEAAARAEHRAGWEYFLPRLASSLAR
jgi:uncharacterized protein YndB with AHSA1/START domain